MFREKWKTTVSLRKVFLFSLVGGFAGIVAGWALDLNILTVSVPLLSMAFYVCFGFFTREENRSTAQFADSAYYLGFLFTLIALLFSLIAITGEDGGVDVHSVLARFGLALITTIFGLTVRIFVVNFRLSGEETLENAEEALARSAHNLRQNIDMLSIDFVAQVTAVKSSMVRATEEMSSASSAVAEGLKTDGAAALAALTESASSAGIALRKTLGEEVPEALTGSVRELVLAVNNDLAGILRALADSVKHFTDAVDSIVLPDEILVAKLEGPLGELGATIEGLAKNLREIETRQIVDISEGLGSGAKAAEKIGAALEEISAPLASANETASSLSAMAKELSASVESLDLSERVREYAGVWEAMHGRIAEVSAAVERDAKLIAERRDVWEKSVQEAEASLRLVHEQLVGAVKFIRKELS